MDEFQNFATPSIATFLSEAPKFRTHLVVANQFAQQIPEEIRSAIIGNVGSQIYFQVGCYDSEFIETASGNRLTQESVLSVPRYHAYCSKYSEASSNRFFSIATIAPKTQ